MPSLPVLTYHSVAPGEEIDPAVLRSHLQAASRSGLRSLRPGELDTARSGFLLTFDDGFVDLWTHGLEILKDLGIHAVVFAIPSRTGHGKPRTPGAVAFDKGSNTAHEEAARSREPHPAFLRWSELEELERSGFVSVQSHSHSHSMGWIGDRPIGFSLGAAHWSLPQATGGDERLGIPVYPRGSSLAHRLFFDDEGLRDHLAGWMDARGGAGYVAAEGRAEVSRMLSVEATTYRDVHPNRGRWETDAERDRRVLNEISRAREELERHLGGRRDELCLPWGQYSDVTLMCARKAGVRRVYTLDRGPNPAGSTAFLVNRFEPRPRGALWVRNRLWIYRSNLRAGVYARIGHRSRRSGYEGTPAASPDRGQS